VTVLDTSVVLDFLLGSGAAVEVERILVSDGVGAAPDLLVFEILAVLRREVAGGGIDRRRADGAIQDLGEMPLTLFPTLMLRWRAWELRDNMTAADALFVALAELLGEPLATGDRRLASAVRQRTAVPLIELGGR
jgi:predicted nucleic acid-binding protein